MSQPDLFTRIRQAKIFQVLAVYLGASWVVLQVADILQEALRLPEWVLPVAVLLLFVGMVVILSTAWVQSLASTTAAEEAGEVPTDWQVAPREAITSLLSGRLPHLTWGRAIMGGVVAMSLLFGFSGLYVLVTGGPALIGPTPAGADVAAEGIAVVPFEVRGDDVEIWREGMMDLLANNLDGVGGYRTIDTRTVMARWDSQVGDDMAPDLTVALRAAGATGARYALLGSVVSLGNSVRLVANIYDLDTREEVAQGSAEGPADEVLTLADDLAVATMRSLLLSTGSGAVDEVQAETITTRSLPAMREFLEGESHYRRGDFAAAIQNWERAVDEDPTFAIALIRLAEAYGWLENENSAKLVEYSDRAVAQRENLSPRYQFVIDAWDALNHGNADGVPALRQAVQKYPDDPEAWFLLAETLIHLGDATYASYDESMAALQRSVELDPGFAPYLIHLAEYQVMGGDTASARETIARYDELTGAAGAMAGLGYIEAAITLFYGTEEEAEAYAAELMALPARDSDQLLGTFNQQMDAFHREELAYPALEMHTGNSQDFRRLYNASTQGALERGRFLMDSLTVGDIIRTNYVANAARVWHLSPTDVSDGFTEPEDCMFGEFANGTCALLVGAAWAAVGDFDRAGTIVGQVEASIDLLEAEAADGWEGRVEWYQNIRDVVKAITDYERDGDPAAARRTLRPLGTEQGPLGVIARMSLGEIEQAEGRIEDAIRHFEASLRSYSRSDALYHLAELHEAAGRMDEARRYYERFLVITLPGDPGLERIQTARAKVSQVAD
jgi:tetratricopeptide (TPR) repeat protein